MTLTRGGRDLVAEVTWSVSAGERWVILGPNGSGKTSLVRLAACLVHPSRGRVEVLGEVLGRVDVRQLRQRVALASAALADQLRPTLSARDVVVTARYAALEPWWHQYTEADRARADACLDRFGCAHLGDRTFGSLSSGERQRVALARTLMGDPALILLDEPAAGLDLGGRERLVANLGDLAADPTTPPVVFVTHHVEEVPAGFTHLLLLRDGRVLAAGPLDEVLTSASLSDCFGLPVHLVRWDDRWVARGR